MEYRKNARKLPPAITMVLLGLCAGWLAHAETFESSLRPVEGQSDVVQVKQAGQPTNIRLYGVACPVSGQPYAEIAKTHLLEAAMDSHFVIDVVAKDSDGLPVAWVRTGEGPSLNEQLVQQGLAWWDQLNAPKDKNLQQAARVAITSRAGLWKDNAPLAPWDYRASHGMERVRYAPLAEAARTEPVVRPPMPAPVPSIAAKGTNDSDTFPTDPQEHVMLMLKHQPRIAVDKQGNPVGLTATDINLVPGAKSIGLQDNDVVQSVNGIKLTSEAQVWGLVSQLQDAKQLELQVLRNGKTTTLTIPLE